MARIRHLPRAPITEAVLDFRARLPAARTTDDFAPALAQLADDYPNKEDAWLIEGSFPVSSGTQRPNGYFLRSRDRTQVVQLRLDGVTFSRLAPYTSWEEIAPEALRIWAIYCATVQPESLFRVAVRYINHIQLSQSPLSLEEILLTAPSIPPGLPQRVTGFLGRLVIQVPTPNTQISIAQVFGVTPVTTQDTLLLDVDVFRQEELETSASSLYPVLEDLRKYKNQAFFGALTEEYIRTLE